MHELGIRLVNPKFVGGTVGLVDTLEMTCGSEEGTGDGLGQGINIYIYIAGNTVGLGEGIRAGLADCRRVVGACDGHSSWVR